jgi:hypothetical protein
VGSFASIAGTVTASVVTRQFRERDRMIQIDRFC